MRTEKGNIGFSNLHLIPGDFKVQAPAVVTPAGSIKMENKGLVIARYRFKLAGQTLNIAAANDYGGLQLVDNFPVKNYLIVGAMFNLAYGVAGFAVNQGDAMDFALGTVTTASAAFSNAGEDDLIEKVDGVGASTTGTAKGHSFDLGSPALIFRDAGANNDLFLNASSAVTSGTGVITFTTGSIVDLFAVDLDEPA